MSDRAEGKVLLTLVGQRRDVDELIAKLGSRSGKPDVTYPSDQELLDVARSAASAPPFYPVCLLGSEIDAAMLRLQRRGIRSLGAGDKARARASLEASATNVVSLFDTAEVRSRLDHVAAASASHVTGAQVTQAAQLCLAFFERAVEGTILLPRARKRRQRRDIRVAWSRGVSGLWKLAQSVSVVNDEDAVQLCLFGAQLLRQSMFDLGAAVADPDNQAWQGVSTVSAVLEELRARFVAGAVDRPVTFCLSLGDHGRWKVRVTPSRCEVIPGQRVVRSDWLLKTSASMFTRIVRDQYTPSKDELFNGTVVTNRHAVLPMLQRVFGLK